MPERDIRREPVGGFDLIDFPLGHDPFLSQPEAFAHSIAAEIESVGSTAGEGVVAINPPPGHVGA